MSSNGKTLVAADRQGPILRLTLQNPPANALSIDVVRALQVALNDARDEETVRVLIVAGSGRLFSAGHASPIARLSGVIVSSTNLCRPWRIK